MALAICARCMLVKRYPLKHTLLYVACFILCSSHTNVYSRASSTHFPSCVFFFFYCTINFSVLKTLSTKYLCFNDSLSFCKYILLYMWQLTSMKIRFLVMGPFESKVTMSCNKEKKPNLTNPWFSRYSATHLLPLCTKPVQLQELGQHGRGQDFISLGLHNGHLVFRCASPVNLRALVSK